MRTALAIVAVGVLLVGTIVFAVLGIATLANLWSDSADSTAGTYVGVGALWLVLAAACVLASLHVARGERRRRRQDR